MAGAAERSESVQRLSVERWQAGRRVRGWVIGAIWLVLAGVVVMRVAGGDVVEGMRVSGEWTGLNVEGDGLVVSVRGDVGDVVGYVLAGVSGEGVGDVAAMEGAMAGEVAEGGVVVIGVRGGVLVYPAEGVLLNEWLVEGGGARAVVEGVGPIGGWFDRLERGARGDGRGVWAE